MEVRNLSRDIDCLDKRLSENEQQIDNLWRFISKIDKRYNGDIESIKKQLEYIERNLSSINGNIRWVVITLIGGILGAVLNIIVG